MGGKSRQSLGTEIAHALADVAKVLDAHEGRAALIGGMAVIARGVQRVTRDIDIAVAGSGLANAALADEMQQHGMSPRVSDAVAFADENQVLLMRHDATGVDIDVSRAWLPFEIEALASADHESLAGIDIVIVKPEDLIIFKSVAWRPQDQQDVERLLALYGDRVDLARIRRHVRELGEAIEEDRLGPLEALLSRLRLGNS
jgi:predicted nucleotidyltransferase